MEDAFNLGSGGFSIALVRNFFFFFAGGLTVVWWVWILASIYQASRNGSITKNRAFSSFWKVNGLVITLLIFITYLKTA